MAPTCRTFRVFLSSTFNDLGGERNALHRHVFPALRQLAMARGARFQVIDLRWGVTDEAAFDQRTVAICLEEIRRCQSSGLKPSFFILLGDRYGWRPLPDEIPGAMFHSIQSLYAQGSHRLELLKTWYRRDDNALPPLYYLKPRTGEWRSAEAWQTIEQELLAVLEAARLALPSVSDFWSWGLSATEMEIHRGALELTDCRDHVYCFSRSIQGFPPGLPVLRLRSFRCFRLRLPRAPFEAERCALPQPRETELPAVSRTVGRRSHCCGPFVSRFGRGWIQPLPGGAQCSRTDLAPRIGIPRGTGPTGSRNRGARKICRPEVRWFYRS